jgi:hypothetical protein
LWTNSHLGITAEPIVYLDVAVLGMRESKNRRRSRPRQRGHAMMGCEGTVEYLVDAVFNYPTFAEA